LIDVSLVWCCWFGVRPVCVLQSHASFCFVSCSLCSGNSDTCD